ncbi:SLATT domain-containing protein [Acinetobacter seifertii]|uniref:SLATT domain-containing protein n=1 Tax=Acinetobacter seifertii TaxID=1530123 RepID=A0A7H2VAB0_9GAMM|nr:SLATT domain-containing protein [Acinetobacter seifertii]MBZ6535114.1 SLATT domain-containing protein [Acinetobacter seifertii]QNX73293.1 SLATT domain-containing protein [Acinetobacter seifertii]
MSKADNVWWTRKAKIENEARLLKYDFHGQILLLWYSFFSVAMSILTLNESSFLKSIIQNGEVDAKLLVVFSVLSLFVSTFVISQNFKERAAKIKFCYEQLKILYVKLIDNENINDIEKKLFEEYESILKSCENHLEKDYITAKVNLFLSVKDKSKVNPHPTDYDFLRFYCNKITFLVIILFIYLFPILILFFI